MKKSEILRGRTIFKQVLQEGSRLEGRFLRCSFLPLHQSDEAFQVAFRVPSRSLNAVRRNRLKRLMREAFSAERGQFAEFLAKANARMALIVSFKGSKEMPAERVSLSHIQGDIHEICTAIAARL